MPELPAFVGGIVLFLAPDRGQHFLGHIHKDIGFIHIGIQLPKIDLNQYMALFIWLWQHKGLPLADKELLLKRTIADSYDYAENYDKIKVRPMDINTKGEFPLVV
ncbi:hypothetical protein K350107B32_09340 [Agathobaculum butyriciproducens]